MSRCALFFVDACCSRFLKGVVRQREVSYLIVAWAQLLKKIGGIGKETLGKERSPTPGPKPRVLKTAKELVANGPPTKTHSDVETRPSVLRPGAETPGPGQIQTLDGPNRSSLLVASNRVSTTRSAKSVNSKKALGYKPFAQQLDSVLDAPRGLARLPMNVHTTVIVMVVQSSGVPRFLLSLFAITNVYAFFHWGYVLCLLFSARLSNGGVSSGGPVGNNGGGPTARGTSVIHSGGGAGDSSSTGLDFLIGYWWTEWGLVFAVVHLVAALLRTWAVAPLYLRAARGTLLREAKKRSSTGGDSGWDGGRDGQSSEGWWAEGEGLGGKNWSYRTKRLGRYLCCPCRRGRRGRCSSRDQSAEDGVLLTPAGGPHSRGQSRGRSNDKSTSDEEGGTVERRGTNDIDSVWGKNGRAELRRYDSVWGKNGGFSDDDGVDIFESPRMKSDRLARACAGGSLAQSFRAFFTRYVFCCFSRRGRGRGGPEGGTEDGGSRRLSILDDPEMYDLSELGSDVDELVLGGQGLEGLAVVLEGEDEVG